jgi:aldehyde dehydrogenase (NAD+)
LIIPSLELGGKNPLIVMEDADLEQAVQGAIWSTYGTAGQRCTSCGNIILHQKIYEPFKKRFLEELSKIRIGNPIQHRDVLYGPMICKKYHDTFLEHYQWGEKDGATLLSGKGRIDKRNPWTNFAGNPETGYYCWPTLWENVQPPMRQCLEEVFGPTTNLIKVKDINDALRVANAPNYGLSSAIYTQNRQYIQTFKTHIEAGMSSINNSTTGAEAHLPFGGIKGSGNGTRESGIWVIDAYTYWHAVNDDMAGKLQLAQMDTEHVEGHSTLNLSSLLPS